VAFGVITPLDYDEDSHAGVTALLDHEVDAADVFTTDPAIKADHLVVLTDPKSLFRAENVVPLVYKPALEADPAIEPVLNYVSLRLTQPRLLALNAEVAQKGASADDLNAIAAAWTAAYLGTS
jgi:osmoprotectant transport system substrate-binding protein